MKYEHRKSHQLKISVACLLACGILSGPAYAQLATATIRGAVSADAKAKAGAEITATNTANGFVTRTTSQENGVYVLSGLAPGEYRIQVSGGGFSPSTRLVVVQVGQAISLDLALSNEAQRIDTISVVASTLLETKTSEVGTNVTTRQIERLPQGQRNFLSFADLAPGVAFTVGNDGSTKLQGGAQGSSKINVFIDGVSQKGYVLQGGITGQDSSRGNPFPQSAIAEYKVTTQNYKAEYDQVSSAAITAVTKSGGNDIHGDVFWDHTSSKWRKPSPSEIKDGKKSDTSQDQFGVSVGGPIIKDLMHYFVSYEGKQNKDPRTVSPGGGATFASLPIALQPLVGSKTAPFKEDLFFGKLDYSPNAMQLFEMTVKVRKEKETTRLGGQDTESYATKKKNDETRLDFRAQITTDNWVNDAHVTYEDAYFNPQPATIGPGTRFENPAGDSILNIGGGPDFQKKGQKGFSLQDDLTFTNIQWNGSHVVKTGVKVKWVRLDAQELQPYNPQYSYDVPYSTTVPYKVQFGSGLLGAGDGTASSKNTQFGIYLQDDWEIDKHLTLNLGARWDYENSPTYNNFVTPAAVATALRGWSNINNANSGVNIDDYINNGSNRSSYKGQFQPRLGFSYDLGADQRNVLFGGAGRSYDRNIFDYLQIEQTKGTFPSYTVNFTGDPKHPCSGTNCVAFNPSYLTTAGLLAFATGTGAGREINLINNKIKVPYADQFSFGIRSRIGTWNTEAAISYIESKDGFVFLLGNRLAGGAFHNPGTTWGAPFGSPIPGFGALILGTSGLETKTTALFLKAEKPYTKSSGWGATVAYTYSDAKENRQFGEHYALDYATLGGYGFLKAGGVAKNRIVATGLYDFPMGFEFSAKLTAESGRPYYGLNCFDKGFDNCKFDQITGTPYRTMDIALGKEFGFGGSSKLKIRADILNLFNYVNHNEFDTWHGGPGDPNLNLGKPNDSIAGPTRTFKLSVAYSW